jgi:hypothetical protein
MWHGHQMLRSPNELLGFEINKGKEGRIFLFSSNKQKA